MIYINRQEVTIRKHKFMFEQIDVHPTEGVFDALLGTVDNHESICIIGCLGR